jgi:hypothetical protein
MYTLKNMTHFPIRSGKLNMLTMEDPTDYLSVEDVLDTQEYGIEDRKIIEMLVYEQLPEFPCPLCKIVSV